jgi:hypothetical protein
MTRQFIEQSEEIVSQCGSPTGERLLQQAKETFRRAENMGADSHFTVALRALQSAHDLAGKAARECGGQQTLQQRYDKLRQQTDQASEAVDLSDEIGSQLLKQTNKQLDLAKNSLDHNQTEAAVAALKAAQMTLDRLKTRINKTDF